MNTKIRSLPAGAALFCLLAALIAWTPLAAGQDFSISMGQFSPFAVDPGQFSTSNLTFVANAGFTGSVSLSCTVTSNLTSPSAPTCAMSPTSMTASGGALATIATVAPTLTTSGTTPGAYTVTVTATGTSGTLNVGQTVTVLAVSPAFTITIEQSVLPNTVTPGNGGIGKVNINPVFDYSGHQVTMSCASITPLVTVPPACQFSPNPVQVTAAGTAQTTVSIITYGLEPTTSTAHPRIFYALWLPLPMLAFAGFGAAIGGKRARRAWGLFALLILGGSLLLLPACGSNAVPSKSAPNGITPNGTYTFTLQGVDELGNISTNTSTGSAPTVTLTVN
jgi:hypothetical protein